jgi:hypothetical protein
MKYSYHPVHFHHHDTRYRVIAMKNGVIMYEKIFKKEEEAKAYVRKQN